MSALNKIAENVWEVVAPLKLPGLRMDHRMTVVRLAGGELLVHSPVQYSKELGRALEELGSVKWLVAPSRFHDLYWPQWFGAFPRSRFVAVRGMREDRSELPFSDLLEAGAGFWDGEVVALPVRGAPKLNEIALLHSPSRSLMVADLLFNIDVSAQNLLGRLFLKANGIYGRAGISRIFRSYVKDKAAFEESLREIQGREFDRIVLGHGANVGGNEALARAMEWAGIGGAREMRRRSEPLQTTGGT